MLISALLLQTAIATQTVRPQTDTSGAARTPIVAPMPRPVRAQQAPAIDGRDDDAVWRTTPAISEFRQFEPTEDGAPTMRTEARIAYDSKNLYVIVRSFDPKPDSILSVLQRRDAFQLSDDVIVGIDSYNDKRTGYLFRLTAAGAMADGYMFNDGEEDWG